MSDDRQLAELRRQLESLQERVAYLEGAVRPPATAEPPQPAAVVAPKGPSSAEDPPDAAHWLKGRPEESKTPPPRWIPTPTPAVPPVFQLSPFKQPTQPKPSLESVIGQNWASWIGGIVFLLGVCFFLKYAWDRGWIRPTPTVRVVAAMVMGGAFCAAGEWVHRKKIDGVLSATLYGAGVAIMMAALFGAHVYFEPPVINEPAAFIGVAIVAVAAVLMSLHINAASLSHIALIGAYLSPAILNTGQDRSVELLTYVGVVTAVGLTVSYSRTRWLSLRWLCWLACAAWTSAWLMRFGQRPEHESLGVAWIGFAFAMFLGQVVATLHKVIPADQDLLSRTDQMKLRNREADLATVSLLNTAGCFAGLWALLEPFNIIWGGGKVHPNAMAGIALGLAAVQAMMIFATPSSVFAAIATLQAMALVTIAVPMLLGQFAITIAWLVLCITIAIAARMTRSRALHGWAVALLMLSIIRLFAFDSFDPALQVPVMNFGQHAIVPWTLVVCATAVLAHVVAYLDFLATPSGTQNLWLNSQVKQPDLLALIGTALFAFAWAKVSTDNTLTTAMIIWWAGCVLLARWLPYYVPHTWGIAGLLWLKWFVIDQLIPISTNWTAASPADVLPLLNMPTLNALLLCVIFFDFARQERRRQSISSTAQWASLAFTLFAILNFEICRAGDWLWHRYPQTFDNRDILKQVSMSVAWGVIGFVAVVVGFIRNLVALRWIGLVLLGLTLAKILLIDMAEVRAFYRILSFLVTGSLLLGVSYAYHRFMSPEAKGGEFVG